MPGGVYLERRDVEGAEKMYILIERLRYFVLFRTNAVGPWTPEQGGRVPVFVLVGSLALDIAEW